MDYRKGTFIIVPNKHVLECEESHVQAVFLWICNYSNEEGFCFPSISTLARKAGCSESSVRRAIERLVATGVLSKKTRKSGEENLSNLYQICLVGGGVPQTPPGVPGTGGVVSQGTGNSIYSLTQSTYFTADAEKKSFEEELNTEPVDDWGEVIQPRSKKKPEDQNSKSIMEFVEKKKERKFTNPLVQMGKIRKMLDTGYTRAEILEEYEYLEKNKFWAKNGVDFLIVASQIHKEHD